MPTRPYMAQLPPCGQSVADRDYYRMARGWLDHELFDGEPYCPRAAWGWLIENAAWRPKTINIRGIPFTLERGQLSFSLSYLAEAWQWSISRVRGFLARLAKRHMIRVGHVTGSRTGRLVITLCNYDRYQSGKGLDRTAGDTPIPYSPHKEKEPTQQEQPLTGLPPTVPPAPSDFTREEEDSAATRPTGGPTTRSVGTAAHRGGAIRGEFRRVMYRLSTNRRRASNPQSTQQALQNETIEEIVTGAEAYATSMSLPRNATVPIMNSAKWLRRRRWSDRLFRPPDEPERNCRVVSVVNLGSSAANVQRARPLSSRQALFDYARRVGALAKQAETLSGWSRPDFDPGSELAAAGG